MRSISSIVLLVILSWTASYGQTGSDTLTCYTNAELNKIADRVVRANECDTILDICEQQSAQQGIALGALAKEIEFKDSIINTTESIVILKETIISGKDLEIIDLRAALNKRQNQTKWIKIGWATTGILAGVALLFLSVR